MTDQHKSGGDTKAVETQLEDAQHADMHDVVLVADLPQELIPEYDGEISDDQLQKMHEEIDSIIDARGEDATEVELDPSSNLLPAAIRRALRRRMPREAIQRFANMTPVTDADGNQAIVRERAVRIHAVVVDYLADKIFGERLSFELVERGTTKAMKDNIILDPTPNAPVKSVFQVIAWAKVRCTVLRNDGSSWIKEDYATMGAEVEGKDVNTAKAYRIAEMGAVTAARRRALQQYGRVFGGFDIRDMENMIGTIREKQKLQEAQRRKTDADLKSQEEAYGGDVSRNGKAGKPALAVDPALRSQTETSNGTTQAKPGAVLAPSKPAAKVEKPVAVKKATKPSNAPQFLFRDKADGEGAAMTDGEIFAKTVIKLINKSKTEEAANLAIGLNRDSIAQLETIERWQSLVTAIQAAHEVKIALFKSRAKKAADAAGRKEAASKRKEDEARAKDAAKSADEAVAQIVVQPAEVETKTAAPLVNLAETADHAGFGGPAKPAAVTEAAAAEPKAWSPSLVTLLTDADGKATNIHAYGQSVLEAVRSAPTIADLDRFLAEIAADLAKINKEAIRFINSTADQRRKAMSAE